MTPKRLLAAAAIALSLAATAGTAAAESKKELVAKVLQLQQPGIEGLGNTVAGNTANQVLQAAGRALVNVPADKREAVAKELQAEVKKFYDDVSPQLRVAAVKLAPTALGTTYDEKFNEEELKTLIAWLESPVNKKFQQIAGEMQQTLGQKLVDETKSQVEPRLKALEQALQAKLKAAAGPEPKAGSTKK
jgi:hypothetical protein